MWLDSLILGRSAPEEAVPGAREIGVSPEGPVMVLLSDAPEGLAALHQQPSRRETPGGQVYRAIEDNHSLAIPGVSGSQDHTTGLSDLPTT